MFYLSCESTVDIPFKDLNKQGVPVLFYQYYVDDAEYEDNMMRSSEETQKFYGLLEEGKFPKTTQINADKYKVFLEELLKKGDVLHIVFGSGMTTSIQNANIAAEELREKYPDRKLIITDSFCSSSGYGLLVNMALEEKASGKSIEEVNEFILKYRKKIHHQFFSTDMKFFKRSGRVTGVAAAVATVLNICPIMHLDNDGRIVAYGKVRGKKNAMEKTVSEMLEHAENGADYTGKCYISHSNCIDDANYVKKLIKKEFPKLKNIMIYDIGCVVASHCGPGTVALFFVGDEREK